MTSMGAFCFLFLVFTLFWSVLVRYIGGEGAGVGVGGVEGGDDVHANATVLAVSCCFTLETSTMQKPRVANAFQTKTSELTRKINKNQRLKA